MENIPDPWSAAAITQNRQWLMAYLMAATGDRHAAEDLVQEVFQIAYEKRESFVAGTNFAGWLRVIARNCLYRYYQKSKKQPVLAGDMLSELDRVAELKEENTIDPDWSNRRSAALKECLKKLTEKVRRIIESRYGEQKSAKEVAELFGMNVSAVNVVTFRARGTLANCIKRNIAS